MNDAGSISPGRSAMRQSSELAAKHISETAISTESRADGLCTRGLYPLRAHFAVHFPVR
jgi:hypothetical protein